jgi:SET family sugar efflux transporter-like MFS transporter
MFWLDEVGVATPAQPGDRPVPAESRVRLLLTLVTFTLLMCPQTLGVQALPLFLSHDLGADGANAGYILGLCAALEIPLMLGLGALSSRIPLGALVLGGAAAGAAYYGLGALTHSVWVLVAGQLLNALYIAAVSGPGISYVQDMLPGQPGRASTLYSNAFPIGAVLAGPLFGLSQHFGYRLAYVMAAGLCLAAVLLLIVVRNDQVPRRA